MATTPDPELNRPAGPPRPLITTSWDDGHPLDLRVADLLQRAALTGTFYIPRTDKRPVMSDRHIRGLSDRGFEVGAHTMDHVVLTEADDGVARRQIADSRRWVSDVTGRPCPMFCPPCGKHTARHVEMIRDAGYRGYRTVELWSTDRPRRRGAPRRGDGRCLFELPTTIQAHPHGPAAVARNLLKRRAASNLWRFILCGRNGSWTDHARSMLQHVIATRGVFHLWGHSWELEETAQWDRLSEVLQWLGRHTDRAPAVVNGRIE